MFRAALYVCAQCGGAIAGAALVYGIHGAHDQFEEVSELSGASSMTIWGDGDL